VDLLEHAYQKFLAASAGGIDALGKVIMLQEGNREELFFCENTCCLYYTSAEVTMCSSCCLDSVGDRVAAYRLCGGGVEPADCSFPMSHR
jgi:hypothetical protein